MILFMKFMHRIYYIVLILLFGCEKKEIVGDIDVRGDRDVEFNIIIPIDKGGYPNRWFYFDGPESGLNDDIYESNVDIKIKNKGKVDLSIKWGDRIGEVSPGEILELGMVSFRDVRFNVASKDLRDINLLLMLKFDGEYHSRTWKLVSHWSDGP